MPRRHTETQPAQYYFGLQGRSSFLRFHVTQLRAASLPLSRSSPVGRPSALGFYREKAGCVPIDNNTIPPAPEQPCHIGPILGGVTFPAACPLGHRLPRSPPPRFAPGGATDEGPGKKVACQPISNTSQVQYSDISSPGTAHGRGAAALCCCCTRPGCHTQGPRGRNKLYFVGGKRKGEGQTRAPLALGSSSRAGMRIILPKGAT